MIWRCRDRVFDTDRRAVLAGIVNVTPDSFSDGGEHASCDAAAAFARGLARDGADILDVGGESTRPGATPVSEDEECARAIPVVEILAREGFAVSIDTRREGTALAALAAGAAIVNCPAPVAEDDPVAKAAAGCGAGFVATWSDGIPASKPEGEGHPETVAARAEEFLREAVRRVLACGVARESIAIDPGFGFGKSAAEDMELLRNLGRLCGIAPLVAGTSRKSFLGAVCGAPDPKRRLGASIASVLAARRAGAGVFRVHDAAETRQALDFSDNLLDGGRAWTSI